MDIQVEFMQNEASFWISLDWWLYHTKPDRTENQQFKDTHYRLRKVTDEKIKRINKEYDKNADSSRNPG